MVVKRNDWIRCSTIRSIGEDVINLFLGFLKYFLVDGGENKDNEGEKQTGKGALHRRRNISYPFFYA